MSPDLPYVLSAQWQALKIKIDINHTYDPQNFLPTRYLLVSKGAGAESKGIFFL